METHRLELFWTDRKSKSSPNVWRRLRNTNSRLIMTEEGYKIESLSRKNLIALKQKNFNDEINNFFMKSHYSKIWNYVKLIRKVSVKWKNYRGSRVPPSTLLQDEHWSRIRTLPRHLQARYRNCKMKLIA